MYLSLSFFFKILISDKTESLEMKTQNGTDNGIPNGNFSTKDKKKQVNVLSFAIF